MSTCVECPDVAYCRSCSVCMNTGADLVSAGQQPTAEPPEKQATLAQIYDLLLAGKKIQLTFPSQSAAASFRSSIYRYKRRTQDQLDSLQIDFDRMSLQWHESPCTAGAFVAMQLVPKKETLFTIVSIQDAAEGTSPKEAQVPGSMGKD